MLHVYISTQRAPDHKMLAKDLVYHLENHSIHVELTNLVFSEDKCC